MRLDGRVWFDFTNPAVWQFYRFIRAFAEAGHGVGLDWAPLFKGSEAEAMSVFTMLPSPADRGQFLHTLLGLVHIEGADANEHTTVMRALEAVDVTDVDVWVDIDALEAMARSAAELGVTETPTLYNHGPVMHVVLNAVASTGDVEATARSILSVLENDGIWLLSKP